MTVMERANWRSYRRHMIIARKTFLGLRRYDVWKRGQLLETFRDDIEAELYIDAAIERDVDIREEADPTARELLATLTPPERTVLESIAQGRSLRDTARELGLSTRDAQAVKKDLFGKVGADSAADALRIGRYGGMAEPRAEAQALRPRSGGES
jgi:DNA-binding NarL/FixJ family response regulator